jgi:tRNA uridine 5-carboxymethylaminomethyl modification enzyme
MIQQRGDDPVPAFSGSADHTPAQVCCWIRIPTTEPMKYPARDRLPSMYTGVIEGVGPRYRPSIEDKITRFAGKDSHRFSSNLRG